VQIRGVARLECFVGDESFVVNALINLSQCRESRTGEIRVNRAIIRVLETERNTSREENQRSS